jgi:hypothetical protein
MANQVKKTKKKSQKVGFLIKKPIYWLSNH